MSDARTPEEMWEAFIAHLNEVRPLGKRGEPGTEHKAFIGSIDSYKKIFLDANQKSK